MKRRTIERHLKRLLALYDLYLVADKLAGRERLHDRQDALNRRNELVGKMNREREWFCSFASDYLPYK